MDFQKLLLDATNALSAEEVKSLAFLCSDILSLRSVSVDSASDLFSSLVDQEHMSAERPQLLIELLHIINRVRLVRQLKLADRGFTASNTISPYRKLLYDLSEEITEDNLKHIKFLLREKLPHRKLEPGHTTLDVFLHMEQKELLSETNLKELEKLIQAVYPALKEKIQKFKALQGSCTVIAQEEIRPRSLTDPVDPQQVFSSTSSLGKTTGVEEQGLKPPTMSPKASSCTSLAIYKESDDCETLTHELSVLWAQTETSLTAEDDALESSPTQENGAEGLECQTSNRDAGDVYTYPMNSTKRGVCLIVDNYDFTQTRGTVRKGTIIDQKSLQAVFQWLGFEVQIEQDCSSSKIESLMTELSSRDYSQMDCLVCCILSHGKEGCVSGVDDYEVRIKDLKDRVDGLKCPTLAGKPKMFFIQACQGNKEHKAVVIESDGHVDCDAVAFKESIPAGADFLVAMSTSPSFVSFREISKGSWFIQTLCQNLIEMVPRGHDLLSILLKVNLDVSLKSDPSGTRKQMPQPEFTITKRVVFPVPKAPPPNLSECRQHTC